MSRNPYLIEGPASICFSGGRTSGYMTRQILKAGVQKSDVHFIFENTGKEREETLEFVQECSKRWEFEVIWLEYDDRFKISNYERPSGKLSERRTNFKDGDWGFRVVDFKTASRKGEPFDRMLDYYAEYRKVVKDEGPILPTVPDRMCTAHLKIKTNTRYMQSLGYDYFDAVLGIRKDEPKRWASMQSINAAGKERYTNIMPMYEAGATSVNVLSFWSEQPFDLKLDPHSYEGNCDFCLLKNTNKLVTLIRNAVRDNGGSVPENVQWWADKEKQAGINFRRDRPNYEGLIQIAMSPETPLFADEPVIDCICGEA